MKLSLDWLCDYVDLSDLPVEEIADRLTMATAETEGIEKVERSVRGLVIGEIADAEKAGKNTKVTVDCGEKKYQTLCGAPNVRVGLKSVFAPAGTTLAGGFEIKKDEREGLLSEGVLCSAKEIGMSQWHEVILECPADIPNGAPLAGYLPPNDFLIEVDNKSLTHRPDLWGHYGFARELAALFNKPLKPLEQVDLQQFNSLPGIDVKIKPGAECACYCCVTFKTRQSIPSPLLIQRRLHALGQRTFNLMVDLTNYVMLEIAQPMHAFDGSTVSAIRVGLMGKKGKFTPLDDQPRDMLEEDLMIWDEKKPVALAGVMGGAETEVTDSTDEILLESANFTGSRIRRTALRLNLRTEASQRFEKDQPPAITKIAIGRMLRLIEQSGAPLEVTSSLSVAGDLEDKYRYLEMPADFISKKAGVEIPPAETARILSSIGFEVAEQNGKIKVGIPPFRSRKDVSQPVDILEEVLRIYGYDNIAPALPVKPIDPVPDNPDLRIEHTLARVLTADSGFMEMHTYSWYDTNWTKKFAHAPQPVLTLQNPTASNNAVMRREIIPNLLEVLSRNTIQRDHIRVFEIGKIYRPERGEDFETSEISALLYRRGKKNQQEVYLELKGVFEKLAKAIRLDISFVKSSDNAEPWALPGNYVDVHVKGEKIGKIGILPRQMQKEVCPFGQCAWFTIDLAGIADKCGSEDFKFRNLPAYPGSTHDFSLVWDKRGGYSELVALLDKFKHPYIESRSFVAYFEGKDIPKGKASYTFRFLLQSDERTLEAADIEEFREKFIKFIEAEGMKLH